jgi:hypothetical protein
MGIFALGADAAQAQSACPMSYETFESAVPHLDLDACPEGVTDKKAFCRAAIGGHQLFVYAFAEEGEKCMIAVKAFDEYELKVK